MLRGGRMIESKYLCTYDLFSSIPTLDGSQDGYAGDLRLERDDEDLVQVAPVPRRQRQTRPNSASAKGTF